MINCGKCRVPSIIEVIGVQYCPDCGQGHEIENVHGHCVIHPFPRKVSVTDLEPWEVMEFPWGSAIRHRKGKWERVFLKPNSQEIDVTNLSVKLSDEGIIFLGSDKDD